MHKALGRGLEALLHTTAQTKPGEGESVAAVAVDKIRPSRSQPRRRFSQDSLNDLADSIRAHGVAQPLLVSPTSVPGEYELIAGERRLRAARLVGLPTVPCVVRRVSERQRHELSLIENIQREDLNPLEEAESLRKLMEDFSVTQDDLAKALGRSRSAVANRLRLLDLPEVVRQALAEGLLTEGHARALLAVPNADKQAELGRRVVREKLTVRDVEALAARWARELRGEPARAPRRPNPDLRRLEESLQGTLGRRVTIEARGKSKGAVRLEFYSIDDLQTLSAQLHALRPGAPS
jgi:ParB family chromosome partitioning protein